LREFITQIDNQVKEIKYHYYKVGWFMRGHLSYNDLMHKISREDFKIYQDIIKENLETTAQTKIPMV